MSASALPDPTRSLITGAVANSTEKGVPVFSDHASALIRTPLFGAPALRIRIEGKSLILQAP
jgi:hypothetical protein